MSNDPLGTNISTDLVNNVKGGLENQSKVRVPKLSHAKVQIRRIQLGYCYSEGDITKAAMRLSFRINRMQFNKVIPVE